MSRTGHVLAAAIVVAVASTGRPANADADMPEPPPVRSARRLTVALEVPEAFVVGGHDSTMPMTGVNVGLTVARHVDVSVDAATLFGANLMLSAGARYVALDGAASPFIGVRAGAYRHYATELEPYTIPYASGGVGVDLALRGGFAAWLEVGLGVASFEDGNRVPRETDLCYTGSLGVGYRVRVSR
ncbi:MAG TPA: hypothetical protein VLB44_21970 [Kofleriaceae bacterium]|nr:hypothetical protein [Kofleriaceae bacterium]